MRSLAPIVAIVLLVLGASPALTQRLDADGVPYRAWDVDIGTGVQFLDSLDGSLSRELQWSGDWEPSGTLSAAAGRYWNSHLKTSVGVTLLSERGTSGQDIVALPDGQQMYVFRSGTARQAQASLHATYQFFENAFAHPYVTVGARIGRTVAEFDRSPYGYIFSGRGNETVAVTPQHSKSTFLRVRPFLAFGSKAYFSERTFVRPELMTAFNSRGLSQVGLYVAFGVDF
jgi:hypothetical protein